MSKTRLLRGSRAVAHVALFVCCALALASPPQPAWADDDAVTDGASNPASAVKEPAASDKPQEASPEKPKEAAEEKPKDAPAEKPKEAAAEKPQEAPAAKPKELAAKPRELTPKPEGPELAPIRASHVHAVYQINWLGSHIGDFVLRSAITNRQYVLQANADISVLFGSFSWRGATSSRGLMTANGPMPQSYAFRYSAGERREAVELRFTQRMVQDIVINPPQRPGGSHVPITAAHLQNVVDPLSAVILLAQARLSRHNESACNRRLPIFDGKMRYDLVLSPKGTRSISGPGRLHGTAYVCAVRYIPIAGHKAGKRSEGDYVTGNTGIEVWLVPLPEAGLLVPYHISVPTPAGTASMTTARFDVETPSGRHALAD